MANPDKPSDEEKRFQELREYYARNTPPEELQDDLDILLGEQTRSASDRHGIKDDIRDVADYISIRRLWGRVIGAPVALIALIYVGFAIIPHPIAVKTPVAWADPNPPGFRLPDDLRFQIGETNISLKGKTFALAGTFDGVSRGAGDITVLPVTITGTNSEGLAVIFKGSLVLTNAPGVINAKRKGDFVNAVLVGPLTIGTNTYPDFHQLYEK